MTDELERRRGLSFLEAEGLTPPRQLGGHSVTRFTRIALMELIEDSVKFDGREVKYQHFRLLWLKFFEQFGSDFPDNWSDLRNFIRKFVETSPDVKILALIQGYCRQSFCSEDHFEAIQHVLKNERLAYRLVGTAGDESDWPTLMPVSTPEQADALVRDYASIGAQNGSAVQRHLQKASTAASDGQFKACVRESIHAVESAAKIASGKPNATLNDALVALGRQKPLHAALKQALSKLYGWTSDEAGIRHAEIEPTEEIPEAMALFMLSSCAAFAAWLLTGTDAPKDNL